VNRIFIYKKLFVTTAIIVGLVTFFGCSSKDNVKYGVQNDMGKDNKSKSIKNENTRNGYPEKYPDYY
jgi:hypothetical protein